MQGLQKEAWVGISCETRARLSKPFLLIKMTLMEGCRVSCLFYLAFDTAKKVSRNVTSVISD